MYLSFASRLTEYEKVQSILRTQSKSRLVGANSPGMISATGRCRLGFHPIPTFTPGCVAIVAKSGTLSYETVASTTRAGLGQSLVIGIGGDPLAGTDFVDALRVIEQEKDTKGIILIGEIGGTAEDEAAEWIKEYRKRVTNPKYEFFCLEWTRSTNTYRPIMALIAGVQAPQGRVMGHAGALHSDGEKDALAKILALEDAGAIITDHPSKFGSGMKQILGGIHPTSTFVSNLEKYYNSLLDLIQHKSLILPKDGRKSDHCVLIVGLVLDRDWSRGFPNSVSFIFPKSTVSRCLRIREYR